MTLSVSILPAFGLRADAKIEQFGSGLINNTWKITTSGQQYILQRVNHHIFKDPSAIAYNIREIATYLGQHHPQYNFVAPLISQQGEELLHLQGEGFFRLFPFVRNSYSIDVVSSAEQAFEAARQFGKFTRLLSGFDARRLKITIPHFHDLAFRYRQFLHALENGDRQRINEASELIETLVSYKDIVHHYEQIQACPGFKLRVTHHDTKISNVLFDKQGKGLCVIDLDTVMPGYFISDVGDMMRTYIAPVSEEEQDFSKIEVREPFYDAIVQGYYSEMKGELTSEEEDSFFYAGKFMIYMQALRFLTDHLRMDIYYGARYEGHNLVRATNQTILLQRLMAKESMLTSA